MAAELTDTKIDQIIPGAKPIVMDGGNGLHLTSKRSLSGERICRSWSFQYYLGEVRISANGRRRSVRREMGLGPYPKIGIKEAYRLAAVAAGLVAQGIDPKADRDAKRAAHALDRARKSLSRSFRDVAREWLAKHEQEWSRRDYAIDVAQSLHNHVYPVKIAGRRFGDLSVNEIDTATVRAVLDPLWKPPDDGGKPHLADKLRSRIEGVLALATVQGLRSADNPATWSGHLEEAYPSPSKRAPREHHPAVEPAHAALFLKALRDIEGHAARALEMLMLTAVRTGSILDATWAHIIDDGQTWWIPNTKTGTAAQPVPQWVPLTQAMVRVLEIQTRNMPIDDKAPIFRITESEMYRLCVKLCWQVGIPRAVPHGFRATFKTTSAMQGWDRVLTEAALSHAIGTTVARAYDRREHHRNLLEARKDLMVRWNEFLNQPYLGGLKVLLSRDCPPLTIRPIYGRNVPNSGLMHRGKTPHCTALRWRRPRLVLQRR